MQALPMFNMTVVTIVIPEEGATTGTASGIGNKCTHELLLIPKLFKEFISGFKGLPLKTIK